MDFVCWDWLNLLLDCTIFSNSPIFLNLIVNRSSGPNWDSDWGRPQILGPSGLPQRAMRTVQGLRQQLLPPRWDLTDLTREVRNLIIQVKAYITYRVISHTPEGPENPHQVQVHWTSSSANWCRGWTRAVGTHIPFIDPFNSYLFCLNHWATHKLRPVLQTMEKDTSWQIQRQIPSFFPMWPWEACLTSPRLSFLIYKMGLIVVLVSESKGSMSINTYTHIYSYYLGICVGIYITYV